MVKVCCCQNAMTRLKFITLGLFVTILGGHFGRANPTRQEKYHGFKVMRVHPNDEHEVKVLKRMAEAKPDQLEVLDYSETPPADDWVDVLASPQGLADLIMMLEMLQIPLETVVPDLPQAIADHLAENAPAAGGQDDDAGVFRLDRYHRLEEIEAWLHELARDHPHTLSLLEIGKSAQGRPLTVVKLSSHSNEAGWDKPAIWLDAGIHSNEWIGPATLLYFIDQLVSGSGDARRLLEEFDWYLLPVFNPDGYAYTWTHDRLWRKSLSHIPDSDCMGVDLNRNWPVPPGNHHHGSSRPNSQPCRHTYAGVQPLSEPETAAVASFLSRHNHTLVAYVAYHAFSQMWMCPYGYSAAQPPRNAKNMVHVAEQVTAAIRAVHGTQYAVGAVADLIGPIPGSSVDYTSYFLNIPYSFGVELRDTGKFGTLLPPDQIVPNSEESWAGVVKLADLLANDPSVNKRIPAVPTPGPEVAGAAA